MSNGIIRDLKGQPIGQATNEHKRAHDPDRVNGIRNHLSQVLGQMKQGWAQDMGHDPQGATQPNADAIRQHWNEKWVATAVGVMNSTDPVEVDPEALDKWIAQQLEQNARKKQMAMPLHKLTDLEPHGFKLVGAWHGDALWICTECAVRLAQGGVVQVVLRPQASSIDAFPHEYARDLENNNLTAELPDYTLGELLSLLGTLRRERCAPLTEEQMNMARHALPQP